MQGKVCTRHKMLNVQLKTWGIPSQVFHHNILRHGEVLCTCAVLMQLAIDDGEKLFEVEYSDE